MTADLSDVRHMWEEQVDSKIFSSPQDVGTRELLLMKLVNFHFLCILSNCMSKRNEQCGWVRASIKSLKLWQFSSIIFVSFFSFL